VAVVKQELVDVSQTCLIYEVVPVCSSSLKGQVGAVKMKMVSCAVGLCSWCARVLVCLKRLAEGAKFGPVKIMLALGCSVDYIRKRRVVCCTSFKEMNEGRAVVTILVNASCVTVCKTKKESSSSVLTWY